MHCYPIHASSCMNMWVKDKRDYGRKVIHKIWDELWHDEQAERFEKVLLLKSRDCWMVVHFSAIPLQYIWKLLPHGY